jgi:hypothetical protein
VDLQELVATVASVAGVEPYLVQEALAEEENDAGQRCGLTVAQKEGRGRGSRSAHAAVFLLLKRQEEAEAVAVQEGKAWQGAAQPRKISSAGAVGRAVKPHIVGQRQLQQQQQQSGKVGAQSLAGQRMGCSTRELPATRRWPNPRAIPRAKVTYREGHLTADSAPSDESM